MQREFIRLFGVGDPTWHWGSGVILFALAAACAHQSDDPLDYGSTPSTGSGAALTSDDTGSASSTTMGGSTAATVTLASSNSSSTDGTASTSTDTTSTSASTSTSDGGSSNTTSSSGGMTSTITSDGAGGTAGGAGGTAGGAGGTAGATSTGVGGNSSGGNGGSSGTGGVTGTGGTSQATTFRYARLVALTSQNGNPFTAIAEFALLDANGEPISSSGWTASADSEEIDDETAPASHAIDGDTGTFWHTEWGDYEAPLPHYLQVDLGSAAEITGFTYTPRQGQDNGRILDWEFFLSNSASDPGAAVAEGSFSSGATPTSVSLP